MTANSPVNQFHGILPFSNIMTLKIDYKDCK